MSSVIDETYCHFLRTLFPIAMQVWILVPFTWSFVFMWLADADLNHATVCDRLSCNADEQCVNRRFWCDHTSCPTMSYCSRSRSDSLRGPDTCASVLCPEGYRCSLQIRDCTWDHGCKQRLARCISVVELVDEPPTCANSKCGKGQHCILRENHYCPEPPCRLVKTCADAEDVKIWFETCRSLGCRSEHECFLRRPLEKCATPSCNHIPDCFLPPDIYESTSSKLCQGWICPAGQVCSARLPGSCSIPDVNCPIRRSCDRHLRDFVQHAGIRTTLTDIERDTFLEEQRRLQHYIKSSFSSNVTRTNFQHYYDDVPFNNGQPSKNPDDAASTSMNSRRVSVSPIMRSTSEHGDSVWLAYLKRRAGAEAIQYWIDKAKNNQDYQGFVEWFDMVSQLLDPDTYHFWLMEVEAASASVPEFQAWISSRNSAAHRPAASSGTQSIIPASITDRPKHFFYNDKNLAFTDHREKSFEGGDTKPLTFGFDATRQLGNGPLVNQPQSPLDVDYGLPRDFGEIVKNSWKSWQSYYQMNPSSLPDSIGRLDDTHLVGNYTNVPLQDNNKPQMFFTNDQYATTLKRNNDAALVQKFGVMMNKIGDLKNFQTINAKLDPNQPTLHPMATTTNDGSLPNLLIYFPPPLNLVIYYSIGNNNDSAAHKISILTDNHNNTGPDFESGRKISNSRSYIPEDYDDDPNFYNKTGLMNKQKEFEFIRKIIKELVNYWDDEERIYEVSKKSDNEAVEASMGNFNQDQSHVIDPQTGKMKLDEGGRKPSYDTFLAWLLKHGYVNSTQFSDLHSERKNDGHEKVRVDSLDMEDNKNTTGKISILVDVEKTSEIVKKLFSRNDYKSQNYSDPRHYQLMVNLNEYADSKEEDLISRKLLNIASKQLHRNMTGNEKIPKVLWVFPVYKDEENETLLDELKKRSKEKVNTLEDVDMPTENTDENGPINYRPHNPDVKERNNDNHTKNVDNFSDSIKNMEDEYYDDQDTYYQNEYEQSDFAQKISKELSRK